MNAEVFGDILLFSWWNYLWCQWATQFINCSFMILRKTDTPGCKRDSGRIVPGSGNYFQIVIWERVPSRSSGNESVSRVL